jgi:pyridoxamine 5'-phosphate oxidase
MDWTLPRPERSEFAVGSLHRSDLAANPFEQFVNWITDAVSSRCSDPYAMTLATATRAGEPSARIVLLKSVDERGFVFCTPYTSPKAVELEDNPHAALVFYWSERERQVRIKGDVERVPRDESARYFQERARGSRIVVMVSQQSRPIEDRSGLHGRFDAATAEWDGREIPLPDHWGGYVLMPKEIEFWQGGINRLHDRFRYRRDAAGPWAIQRLAP